MHAFPHTTLTDALERIYPRESSYTVKDFELSANLTALLDATVAAGGASTCAYRCVYN